MQDIGLCKMNGQHVRQAGTLHGDVVKLYQSDLVIHDTGAGPARGDGRPVLGQGRPRRPSNSAPSDGGDGMDRW